MVASMIQHVTNTRTDKQLRFNDIRNITYASCLNIFHTNSMFNPWPLGVFFAIDFDWIKKIDGDKYMWQRSCALTSSTSLENMSKSQASGTSTLDQIVARYPILKPLQNDLVCYSNGDEKLVINCYYRPANYNKSKLGFFLMNPIFDSAKFGYHLIIIPKPGLFPVKF